MSSAPIAERLFTWPAEYPQLIGAHCDECGTTTFPVQDSCPECGGFERRDVLLPRDGTLWTWTTQSFPPIAPPYIGPVGAEFRPFGIGWVELDDGVLIEARLTEADPDKLCIGARVTLVIEVLAQDAEGRDILSFAFAPSGEA